MTEVDYESAIAIIGMAGRFPGADSVDELWENVLAGRLGLRHLSDDELLAAGVSPAQLADPGYVRTSGPINGHDMFDATLFGLNRREAEGMDPQHRLFLEICYEALENAGYPPLDMAQKTGIFAGCGFPDYMTNLFYHTLLQPGGALMMAIGCERDSLSSFVSYKLNLRGPSVTVQTFCSTSLISVHLAAQALLNFECEVALAGGVFIPLPQGVGYAFEEGGILSPDGKVRPFDAAARGSVMGSGVSAVTLKRLPDALADGDNVLAVILGSATNNDGSACAGYTAPGTDGQADVIADALAFAGVKPESIGYVECHGTGTVLGDSIEVAAMDRVFPDRPGDPLVIGSLKASIGHLDRSAGTASLIRAVLALRNRVLPATPNYENPNQALAGSRGKFTVLTQNQPWPAGPNPRRAGVSSFGLGGSNAHVVLEESPAPAEASEQPGPHVLLVSGRDAAAADESFERLLRHLDRHRELAVADVAFTLQQSRGYFPIRRAVICDDADDARRALGEPRQWLTGHVQQRDPLVDLVLAEPAGADEDWTAVVGQSAGRITGEKLDPSAGGLAVAVGRALIKLGIRIGRVSGPRDAGGQETDGTETDGTETGGTETDAEGAGGLAGHVAEQLGLSEERPCQTVLVVGPDAAGGPARHWFTTAVARLWLAGAKVDWAALHSGTPRRVVLPPYPFQRRRYWVDGSPPMQGGPGAPAGRVDDIDQWTYLPSWRGEPLAIQDQAGEIADGGPWLVLASETRGMTIAARLRQAGARVLEVRTGANYAREGDGEWLVRPGNAADLEQVLASAAEIPARVIHAFALSPGAAWEQGYGTAVALTRAYSRVAPALDIDLLAVTEGALAIAGEPPANPGQAALAGLLPVMAQETPGWICRHVDIGAGPVAGRAEAALADALIAEALVPYLGPVALRGHTRWLRRFSVMPLAAPDEVLPRGSVVLITGGMGHVGLILARHLAAERACRLVLTARTPLPARSEWEEHAKGTSRTARQVSALLEIERLGGEVLPVAADVADPDQVRAVVALADERFGGIDLVVHAAGISDPSGFGPAHLVTAEGTRQHFDAKVGGFEALCAALAGRDVPGITLSSLSAILGGLSLGPYAAANAQLDAHVLAARARSGLRWLTVDWDTWGRDPAATAGHPPGEFDMAPGEAIQVFERVVAAIDRAEHIVISTGSLTDRFARWIVARGLDSARAGGEDEDYERDPRPDLVTPFVRPEEGTEATLAAIWARVLRLEEVGAEDDFFGLGGNSVLAIEVVSQIRKELRVPVPTSAVLGYPTVRGLAAQIDELARDDGGADAAPPDEAAPDEAGSAPDPAAPVLVPETTGSVSS